MCQQQNNTNTHTNNTKTQENLHKLYSLAHSHFFSRIILCSNRHFLIIRTHFIKIKKITGKSVMALYA